MDLKNMTILEKKELAENLDTPKEVLRKLAKDTDWGIRWKVAKNPNTDNDTLQKLAKTAHRGIKTSVAQNPNISANLLRDLIKNENLWVRGYMAASPESSNKLLIALFEHEKSLKDPKESVIKLLHRNPNLPLFAQRVIETLFWEIV